MAKLQNTRDRDLKGRQTEKTNYLPKNEKLVVDLSAKQKPKNSLMISSK